MFMPGSNEFDKATAWPIAPAMPGGIGSLLHSKILPETAGYGEGQLLNLHLINSNERRETATSLVNRMYAWRGYGDRHRLPVDAHSMTFTASIGEAVVGTVTLTVDSDRGLAADKTFRDELNTYRRVPGAKICELTKLAFDTDAPSRPLLAALFHIVFILGRQRHDCTDLFIEVNPRHRRFYQSMLGFERVGETKTNESVGAPSQLMRLRVSQIQTYIDECRDASEGSVIRSLYADFLSAEEQAQVASFATERNAARRLAPRPEARVPAIWLLTGGRKAPGAADKAWSIALRRTFRSMMVKAGGRKSRRLNGSAPAVGDHLYALHADLNE